MMASGNSSPSSSTTSSPRLKGDDDNFNSVLSPDSTKSGNLWFISKDARRGLRQSHVRSHVLHQRLARRDDFQIVRD